MSEKTTKPSGLALLREPFPEHQISLLPKPYSKDSPKGKCAECGKYHGLPAVHLSYVGHAALTDRLLDVDPNWTWEPLAIGADGLPAFDKNGGLWIKLTICGMTRLGYGDAQGKTGGNAVKEAVGDALRNSAMRYGAALELWHKGQLHIDEDEPESPAAQPPGVPTDDALRELFIPTMRKAAEAGLEPLQTLWQSMSEAARSACAQEKERLKSAFAKPMTNGDKPPPILKQTISALTDEAKRVGWSKTDYARQLMESYHAEKTGELTEAQGQELLAQMRGL